MKVVEFYLKSGVPEEAFEALCDGFYRIGPPARRRIDSEVANPVFAVSRNPSTRWVQLLIDEDTPGPVLTAILNKAKGLSDDGQADQYDSPEGTVTGSTVKAPPERPRKV